MRRTLNLGSLLLLALAGLAGGAVAWQQGLTPRERLAITAWLECLECGSGELDSVRAIGSREPGASVAMLSLALRIGPSDSSRTSLAVRLARAYDRDTAYARREQRVPRAVSRAQFTRRYVGRYVFTFRVRAAVGLGWIATPGARAALDSILADPLPEPLRQRVRFARDSLPLAGGPGP